MNPLMLSVIADAARGVLDRVLPDPVKRAEAEAELARLAMQGTFEQQAEQALKLAQLDVTKAEAQAGGFRGGWRPAAGWVCVAGLGLEFVAFPLLSWGAAALGSPVPTPPTLSPVLFELLACLLGLAGFRSFDKLKGRG